MSEINNLINNFLNEKNSFVFESVEKGVIKGRYTIFGRNPDKIWEFNNNNCFNYKNNKKIKINSINEDNLFTSDSIKLIYSLTKNNFLLIGDKNKNIYLAKIDDIIDTDLSDKNELLNYTTQSNIKIQNDLYNSYDYLINSKYKITINENTLERIKNHFR